MVLKPEVIEAFNTLGIKVNTEEAAASRAYKKLALLHHPDRNRGDKTATKRFQQIGAAWDICSRHYENPLWSQMPDPAAETKDKRGHYSGRKYSEDEDIPLDPEEAAHFFRFMFEEMIFGRFSRAKGQRYRHQRSGATGGGIYAFSGGFAESQQRQSENTESQRREREAYEKRLREFEIEIEAEQRELDRIALEKSREQDRRASAQIHAFQSGRSGKSAVLRSMIVEFELDVNAPQATRKLQKKPQQVNFETMLHVAAESCDEDAVLFLLNRGADPTALNTNLLMPFHVAILYRNVPVVRFFLAQRGKSTEGCHSSKAAPDGRTPLQLAIASGSADMVQLLLKDATVHDVERCWQHNNMAPKIKEILATKKGFTPPASIESANRSPDPNQVLSKKVTRKQEAAKKQAAEKEKARRVAEGSARAAENLRRKQERAEKHAAQELAKEAIQRVAEAKAEAERRQQAEEEARRKAEEEAKRRVEEDARRQAQERATVEAAHREAATKEQQRKKMVATEARRKQKQMDEARRVEQEEHLKAQAKREQQQREEVQLIREAEERRLLEETATAQMFPCTHIDVGAEAKTQAREDPKMRKRAEQSARDKARYQRMRMEKDRLPLKHENTNQALKTKTTLMLPAVITVQAPRNDPPALHPKADQTGVDGREYDTPGSTADFHALHRYLPNAPSTSTSVPSTLPSELSSVPRHKLPNAASLQPRLNVPLSPQLTPEDLQTCVMPEDLFRYEGPNSLSINEVPSMAGFYPELQGRDQGQVDPTWTGGQLQGRPCRGRGRGDDAGRGGLGRISENRGRGITRGRGRGRGTRRGRAALEEELARKDLELQRMAEELAAARARAS